MLQKNLKTKDFAFETSFKSLLMSDTNTHRAI